ncbi:hypothetical protein BB560_004909 [Smittium megazygosporum]|uniref:SPX domain-containing protein n=1 Tax=Smittium megazygosporum TaxID=133381 RepID=A0A2T9Z7X7_9FUNG|nr:hypothetical protein BB560_004909 [Smittium megazygosporum]
MNNEKCSEQPEPVPKWATKYFDRKNMLQNISSRIENVERNLKKNSSHPMLQDILSSITRLHIVNAYKSSGIGENQCINDVSAN